MTFIRSMQQSVWQLGSDGRKAECDNWLFYLRPPYFLGWPWWWVTFLHATTIQSAFVAENDHAIGVRPIDKGTDVESENNAREQACHAFFHSGETEHTLNSVQLWCCTTHIEERLPIGTILKMKKKYFRQYLLRI